METRPDKQLQDWAYRGLSGLRLVPLAAAPERPRKGLVVYADGSTWNPGSGEGVYRYNGSAWVFLG